MRASLSLQPSPSLLLDEDKLDDDRVVFDPVRFDLEELLADFKQMSFVVLDADLGNSSLSSPLLIAVKRLFNDLALTLASNGRTSPCCAIFLIIGL